MKLSQILEQNDAQQSLQQYAQVIVRDCQPVLREVGDIGEYNLLRGMTSAKKDFIDRQIRSDRAPRDTEQWLHELADQWFKDKFGAAFRSNAIAVSSAMDTAHEYGDAYMVFPKGHFSFIWSPMIADVGSGIENYVYEHINRNLGKRSRELSDEQLQQAVYKTLDDIRFNTDDLYAAMKSGHEVMIHADSYHGVRLEQSYTPRQVTQAIEHFSRTNNEI